MAYSQAIVQRAMQRLQSENEQNEQSSRARIAAIYEKQPRLGEIDRELRRTAAHVLAATFRRQGDPVAAMQQLKKDNQALQQERDWILQAEGLEPDDLTVQPLCPKCGGTGYVGAQMCECLRELCRQEQKKELLRKKDTLLQATYEFYFENDLPKRDNILKKQFDSAVKIIEKLIEAGVENGEFLCEDCEGTARNIMFVLEGLKISAQTIGVTAEAVDREILYLLRGLGVEE